MEVYISNCFSLVNVLLILNNVNIQHCAVKNDDCNVQTLQLVQCIFRHGNRTLDSHEGYDKDPYDDESAWLPLGMGQLTSEGRNTEYSLGKALRTRYTGFLSRTYYYRDISVTSSNLYRTKESAQLVCAGLYSPPIGYNKWGSGNELGNIWQPIPVSTMPKQDLWLQTQESCPPYDKDYEDVLKNTFADTNAKFKDLYDYLSKHTGENVKTVREVAKIYNTLKVEEENDKRLPDWATPATLDKMDEFRLLGLIDRTCTDFMKVVKGGPMLQLISVNVNNKTNHCLSPDNKMILYSAHDTTIVHILHTLGAVKIADPQYGACIMIELHQVRGQYFVKVVYLESGLATNVRSMQFHDWQSDAPIPLDTFNKMLDKYKISESEWYKKCQRQKC